MTRTEEQNYHYALACRAQVHAESRETLYVLCYTKVLLYAKKLCNHFGLFAEDAFDIVSEAFFKCFNKIEQFRRGCLFSSWVCGFVRNIAFKYRDKAYAAARRTEKIKSTFAEVNILKNPERVYLRRELCARLWTAFYSLSPLHRIILQYAVLREMTKTEMRRRISAAYGKRFAVRVDEETEYEIALSVLRAPFFKGNGRCADV